MKKIKQSLLIALCLTLVIACSDKQAQQERLQQAVAIETADECHLCGMLITRFAGPKGELFQQDISEAESQKAKKFCSTRDMFSYYLDPENKRNVTTILVHDMSKMPWEKLDDNFFIDAKTAWYVIGSDKKGAMGSTLASFSTQDDAKAFSQQFGGKLISFKDITLESLQ